MLDLEERGKGKENPYHVNCGGIYLSKKKKKTKNTANELSFPVLSVLYTVSWLIYPHNIVSMGQYTASSQHII